MNFKWILNYPNWPLSLKNEEKTLRGLKFIQKKQ